MYFKVISSVELSSAHCWWFISNRQCSMTSYRACLWWVNIHQCSSLDEFCLTDILWIRIRVQKEKQNHLNIWMKLHEKRWIKCGMAESGKAIFFSFWSWLCACGIGIGIGFGLGSGIAILQYWHWHWQHWQVHNVPGHSCCQWPRYSNSYAIFAFSLRGVRSGFAFATHALSRHWKWPSWSWKDFSWPLLLASFVCPFGVFLFSVFCPARPALCSFPALFVTTTSGLWYPSVDCCCCCCCDSAVRHRITLLSWQKKNNNKDTN